MLGRVVEGSFSEKWGTPRQGNCVTSAVGVVELYAPLPSLVEGADVVVLFVFHLNNNQANVIGGQTFAKLPSMIEVPKCASGKQSVFATRSPHRPNPIGLTICKLKSLKTTHAVLSGVDLVVGTPIIDILPYQYGYYRLEQARFPPWVTATFDRVANFDVCAEHLGLDSAKKELVVEIMKQDCRSRRSRACHQSGTFCHRLADNEYLVYRYRGNEGVCVIGVYSPEQLESCLGADLLARLVTKQTSGRAPEVLERIQTLSLTCCHQP